MSIQLCNNLTNNKYLYSEQDLIAKGGFGEVYKGKDKQTQEVIAIKRVDKQKIDKLGEEFLKCLGNEANLLLEMNYNDKCVRIIDCFATNSSVYIIMEYCDGGTVEGILKKAPGRRLPEKEALMIFSEVVEGLNAMHARGTMHRDMKPDNVFIKGGRYKIGDFGFATRKDKTDQICGTPQYMAPEIHNAYEEGAQPYTKQVDVWAIGIMLHEMLYGERPFEGNQIKIANTVKSVDYKVPNTIDLTSNTKDLLLKMLARDPNKRITMSEIVLHPALCQLVKNPMLGNSLVLNSAEFVKDLSLSSEMEQSIKKDFDDKHVKRITCKLEYYRQSCGFFFKRFPEMKKYVLENKALDDLHPLIFYCIKFSLCKFKELYEVIVKKECPSRLMLTYDADYWLEYVQTQEYQTLLQQLKEGIQLTDNLLKQFKSAFMPGYLDRKGRSQLELTSIYDEDLQISCSATLELRLNEAGGILQKVSNQHNEYITDLTRFYADIDFCKKIKQYLDNNKYVAFVDRYVKDRDSGNAQKVEKYVVEIISFVNGKISF